MLSLALLLTLQVAPPTDEAPALEIDSGAAIERFTHREYRNWLVHWRGLTMSSRYAQLLTARDLAPERGVHVTEESVATALEDEVRDRVERAFAGDVSGWEAELAGLGRTVRGYRLQRRTELEEELLWEGLARAARVIDEAAERLEWERDYGVGGREYDVRAISLKFSQPSAPVGTPPEELQALRERARQVLEARAQAIRDELLAGADFDALLAKYADDPSTKDRGGRFESFPPLGWPGSATEAMFERGPGAVLEPVFSRGSFHIVRIDAVRTVTFEEARADVRQALMARPIDAGEMGRARSEVAAATLLELAPALTADPTAGRDDDVVLITNGRAVTRAEFGTWIVRIMGEHDAPTFTQVHRVASDCAALGLGPTDAEVRARIVSDIDVQVERAFLGDRERWLQSIGPRFMSESAYVNATIPTTQHHLRAEALIRHERAVDDERVRKTFEQRYGQGGRRIEARWIRWTVPIDNSMSNEELAAAQEETRAEAVKIRRRLMAGEDFGTLARRISTDPRTRDLGGSPESPWNPDEWRAPVRVAIDALETGQISDPIIDREYVWIFEILSDRRVAFDDVRDELRAELKNARPSDPERAAWLNLHSRRYEVRRLDGLYH